MVEKQFIHLIAFSRPLQNLISNAALDLALESHSIRTYRSRALHFASVPFSIHSMVLFKHTLGIENGGDLS